MVDCPNCRNPMTPRSAEVYGVVPRSASIASCAPCNLFWFADSSIVGLTPHTVLTLFQFIGEAGAAQIPLAANFTCPGCRHTLQFTHDLQHNTRFTYWRCAEDHGQLITFGQFLAEKNMVRPPSAAELVQLRATVRQVACSQCGAPIDLQTESACSHCGAAIALIDPEGVAKALRELAAGSATPAHSSQDDARTLLCDAQLNALFDAERTRAHESGQDLLAIGAAAIGAVVGSWLTARR